METGTQSLVTLRDTDVRYKVRTMYLDNKSIKEIQQTLGINVSQWDSAIYLNIQGFREFFQEIKKEKMLQDAEKVSKKILDMKADGDNAKLLAIQQKEAEFIRETQGKDQGYSKRVETIGLNINKNEPLDDEQKEKLNKILKSVGHNEIEKDTQVV